MKWLALVGQWTGGLDGDWRHIDRRGLPWSEARRVLADYLEQFRYDTCADCSQSAVSALAELERLASDQPWRSEIDGEDLLLVSA